MSEALKYTTYPAAEERINVYSHGIGLVLSVVALVVLTLKAHGMLQVISVSVFAISMISLYGSSTIYHGTTDVPRRIWLRTVDRY